MHFDTANGVCHLRLQECLGDKESQVRQESITAAGTIQTIGWLQSSELHVATRLVSFLVRWVNCKDHPPGLEDIQLMLQQMRLQIGGSNLDKMRDVSQNSAPLECTTSKSKGSTVYRRTRKRRASKQTESDSSTVMTSGEPKGGTRVAPIQQSIQMVGVLLAPPRKIKGLPNHWTLSRQPLSQADQIATQIRVLLPIPDSLTDHSTPTPTLATIPEAGKMIMPAPIDLLWDQRFFVRIQPTGKIADMSTDTRAAGFDALVVRSLTLQDVQTLRGQRPDLDLSELETMMAQLPTKARFTVPAVVGLEHYCEVCESSGPAETLVSIPSVNLHLFPYQFRVQSRFKSDRSLMELDA